MLARRGDPLLDRGTIFGRRRQYQVGGVQPIHHQNDGEPIHDGEVPRNVGCCCDDPDAVVEIATKLPHIAIEVDVVENQYGVGRWCECESTFRERRLAASGRAVEQDRVTAQDGDLNSPLGGFLAFDEFEVVDHSVFSVVELPSTRGYSQLFPLAWRFQRRRPPVGIFAVSVSPGNCIFLSVECPNNAYTVDWITNNDDGHT